MKKLLVLLLALALGTGIGYFFTPTKTIETTREVVVEKIVEVESKTSRTDRDILTTTVIEVKPDGTTITTITETDKSVDTAKTEIETVAEKETDKEEKKVVTRDHKNWIVSALVPANLSGVINAEGITFSLHRRIIGELYAGPFASLKGDFGIGLSLRF